MTIDQAIVFLTKAKAQVGGDACLILSLTDSELPDHAVDGMTVIKDESNGYVQVEVTVPEIIPESPNL